MSNDTLNEQIKSVEHFFLRYPESVAMERLKEMLLEALNSQQAKDE